MPDVYPKMTRAKLKKIRAGKTGMCMRAVAIPKIDRSYCVRAPFGTRRRCGRARMTGGCNACNWISRIIGGTPNAESRISDRLEFKRLQHRRLGSHAALGVGGEGCLHGAQALTVTADPFFNTHRKDVINAVNTEFRQNPIPVCYPFLAYVEDGGFMSVGPNLAPAYCQLGIWAATLLNKSKMKASALPTYKVRNVIGINLAAAKTPNLQPARLSKILAKADVIV
jgi:hypothetical protein